VIVIVFVASVTVAAVIATVKACVASGDTPFEARTVNEATAAEVGVPVMAPVEELSDKPAGSDPEMTDQVKLDGLPVAAKLCEYAAPIVPPGNEVVVMVGGVVVMVGEVIVMLRACVASGDTPFEARTVNEATAVDVGVPVIAPVEEFSDKPAGKDPETTDQVKLDGFPVAVKLCEYAAPVAPPGNEVVMMVGGVLTVGGVVGELVGAV
jgi:hypothetical protein